MNGQPGPLSVMWMAKRDEWEADLAALQEDLAAEESEGIRENIHDDIKHAERILSIIGQLTEKFRR